MHCMCLLKPKEPDLRKNESLIIFLVRDSQDGIQDMANQSDCITVCKIISSKY